MPGDDETTIEEIISDSKSVFKDDGFKWNLSQFLDKHPFSDKNLKGLQESFGDIMNLKIAKATKVIEDRSDAKIREIENKATERRQDLYKRIGILEKSEARHKMALVILGASILVLIPCIVTILVTIWK